MGDNEDKTPVLTRFVVGQTTLLSRGISYLKITETDEEGNQVSKLLPLPIKSLGIADIQESYIENLPKPREKLKTVKKGTEEAIALGLTEDKEVAYLDTTDPEYRAEIRKLNDDMLWDCILKGLDIDFVDKDGNPITDDNIKKAELINAGITGHHIDQLMKDINELTRTLETRADFLSKMLSASPTRF
jgi:hypothetical protein